MFDEERYFAAQDASAIENDPAFERGYENGARDGAIEAYTACAALVRAAGCLCFSLALAGDFSGQAEDDLDAAEDWRVDEHDPRCPEAIADQIESGGKE